MKIVCDNKIPFLEGALEPYAQIVYLPGSKTTADVVSDGWIEAMGGLAKDSKDSHAGTAKRNLQSVQRVRGAVALTGAAHVAVCLLVFLMGFWFTGLMRRIAIGALVFLGITAVLQVFPKMWGADRRTASGLSYMQQIFVLLSVCVYAYATWPL